MFKRTATALAVASCFASGVVQANPTNPVVVSGTAVLQQSGNLLSITNGPNAIINWGSFSIGANEITRFIQQSQASAVLNRVVGQDPSAILGALQSNGRVFLINPNGIVFGAGSQIDVAGLVASTLNLSDADFLAGRLRFTETLNAGSVVNQGSITTGAGGSVYLVAPDITNSGIITSPGGEVILAAGRSVELVDPGTPNLRVEISAPDTQARNLGRIVAEAGRVGIYAGLINHAGTIQANSAVLGERGEIVLKATQSATLEAGSLTTANGAQGGSITIQSGDTTLVSGTVEARGTQGQGGAVQILGNLVGLTGSAVVDASGETGGGTVLVGGDYQGKNPDIQNAYRTYFGPDASIKADAITSGDGGRVIVWADDATRAYGSISARGGSQSGNGGFVEVSGKSYLDFRASVNTRAPFGVTGTLLLDPTDIEINASNGPLLDTLLTGDIFQDILAIATSEITASTLETLLGSTNVTIKTSNPLGVAPLGGTVTFNANVIKPDTGGTTTLRVEAENDIIVDGNVTIGATSTTNPLNVNFIANSDNTGSGSIRIGNGDNLSIIDTKGGNIFLGGSGTSPAIGGGGDNGVLLSTATLNAGTGAITIRGQSGSGADGSSGVALNEGSEVITTSGNITIEGFGTQGDNSGLPGILLEGSGTKISSTSGTIQLTGTGGDASSGSGGAGIVIRTGALIESTGAATITLNGTGGNSLTGSGENHGIFIDGTGTKISSAGGNIVLEGTARGAGTSNTGVVVQGGAVIEGLSSAGISITGFGADTPSSSGIRISDLGTSITSVNGAIELEGTGGDTASAALNNNYGIVLSSLSGTATIASTGTGSITLTGTGGSTPGNGDHGILIGIGGKVSVSNGNLALNGTGGTAASGTGVNDIGIVLGTNALVESLGSGSITLTGIGGNSAGGGGNSGISMLGGSAVDSSGTGSIVLNGTGRGAGVDNRGVRLDGAQVRSDGATISITGIGAPGNGLEFVTASLVGGAASGDITLIADSMSMSSVNVQSPGTVFVRPLSFTDISIGTTTPGALNLTSTDIQNIDAGVLQIGLGSGAGDLNISGATVSGQSLVLIGNNINIGNVAESSPTSVSASNALTMQAVNNLTVQGGVGTGASAEVDSVSGNTTVIVGGDVLVRGGSGPGSFASLTGGPDLFMTVGGMVRMDAGIGAGAYGQIASTSPNSIQILFPNLGVGGYFVNGVEYTVYDALSASGFLAGGVPAILGNNLLITYGIVTPAGLLPPVIETTTTLVDGLLQTGAGLINTALQSGRELIAVGGEVLNDVEYIGVWGIVDSVRKEFICR